MLLSVSVLTVAVRNEKQFLKSGNKNFLYYLFDALIIPGFGKVKRQQHVKNRQTV